MSLLLLPRDPPNHLIVHRCCDTTAVLPGEAWLPQQGLGLLALRRLRGGAQEAAHVAAAAAKAARDLGAMAAQGFFLPFCLTMTAALARVHVRPAAGYERSCCPEQACSPRNCLRPGCRGNILLWDWLVLTRDVLRRSTRRRWCWTACGRTTRRRSCCRCFPLLVLWQLMGTLLWRCGRTSCRRC